MHSRVTEVLQSSNIISDSEYFIERSSSKEVRDGGFIEGFLSIVATIIHIREIREKVGSTVSVIFFWRLCSRITLAARVCPSCRSPHGFLGLYPRKFLPQIDLVGRYSRQTRQHSLYHVNCPMNGLHTRLGHTGNRRSLILPKQTVVIDSCELDVE
jgi:hypothetical protein